MAVSPYQIRELEVTDIRCHAEGCAAGPGERCRTLAGTVVQGFIHASRRQEFGELKAAGWLWQEPDPADRGEPRKP